MFHSLCQICQNPITIENIFLNMHMSVSWYCFRKFSGYKTVINITPVRSFSLWLLWTSSVMITLVVPMKGGNEVMGLLSFISIHIHSHTGIQIYVYIHIYICLCMSQKQGLILNVEILSLHIIISKILVYMQLLLCLILMYISSHVK